jgi:hypothetical protein
MCPSAFRSRCELSLVELWAKFRHCAGHSGPSLSESQKLVQRDFAEIRETGRAWSAEYPSTQGNESGDNWPAKAFVYNLMLGRDNAIRKAVGDLVDRLFGESAEALVISVPKKPNSPKQKYWCSCMNWVKNEQPATKKMGKINELLASCVF